MDYVEDRCLAGRSARAAPVPDASVASDSPRPISSGSLYSLSRPREMMVFWISRCPRR